jgi:hypothetical protein
MPRLVVGLGGSVRGVASDKIPWRQMFPQHSPPRASRVEIIDVGDIVKELEASGATDDVIQQARDCKRATLYFVDFSPLADVTNNNVYRCCLLPTFAKRADAIAAEIKWLEANYVDKVTETEPKPATGWAKELNLNALRRKPDIGTKPS